MSEAVVERIKRNPKYQELKAKRNRFGWTLTILMLVVYYGYIGLIAFDKEFLARPLGAGVTTLGVPIGMAVIVFTIVITGIYVFRANSEYDAMTRDILKDATK
ncbi:MAG: DUF485 domain-containing protein [Proteobacteria bacterium]|nr:DUF485 domain-containing protein [Pseudomonadota bacterium]